MSKPSKPFNSERADIVFQRKLLERNGHEIGVTWTGEEVTLNGYQVKTGQSKPDIRHVYEIKCMKNGCGWRLMNWNSRTTKPGHIPAKAVTSVNAHLRSVAPQAPFDHEPEKILDITMKRGNNTEMWVAHLVDTDFLEVLHSKRSGYWYKLGVAFPWGAYIKNSRDQWSVAGVFSSRDEAVGVCTKQVVKYESKGYRVEVLDHESSGHTPPTATVAISVKALINEYKGLRKNATPIEVKAWLDRVGDALTNMELLSDLYREVQDDLITSLEL